MRVLMVDDHVMVLQGLKNLLGVLVAGVQVDTANAIGVAVTFAAETRYDLVLLDWHLDDCSGAESIQRLRDVGCAARIVVLSGDTGSVLIRQAIELGAAGFVPPRWPGWCGPSSSGGCSLAARWPRRGSCSVAPTASGSAS